MARGEIKALVFASGTTVTPATAAPSTRYRHTDTTGWTGAVTSVTYDVSSFTDDATTCIWQLQDTAANNYMQIDAEIDFPSATTVRVTVGIALASGTYYLVGV